MTALKPKEDSATETGKAWRCWWRHDGLLKRHADGAIIPAHTPFPGRQSYASKHEAETEGFKSESEQNILDLRTSTVFLGAYPEGSRP